VTAVLDPEACAERCKPILEGGGGERCCFVRVRDDYSFKYKHGIRHKIKSRINSVNTCYHLVTPETSSLILIDGGWLRTVVGRISEPKRTGKVHD
jgi:hypothetical protein